MIRRAWPSDRAGSLYPVVVYLAGEEHHLDAATARQLHTELGAALAAFGPCEWSETVCCTWCGVTGGQDCAPRCPGDITELPPAIGGEEEA